MSELGVYHTRGRHRTIKSAVKQQLIQTATADAHHYRLPLPRVAEIAGVQVSTHTLHRAFASEGYHRHVARVKPFLSPAMKLKRKAWGARFQDWENCDWSDVI